MRILKAIEAMVRELISLVADDPVLVVGAFIALGAGFLLGKAQGAPHRFVGPVVFLLVWGTIGGSLWRFVRQRTR